MEPQANPTTLPLPAVTLNGVRLDAITQSRCVEEIFDALDHARGGWVITPNLDHLRRAHIDPDYASLLAEGDLVVADGMPLIWASRVQGTPLPERVAGSSLIDPLCAAAAERGRSIFMLGGEPGAAEEASRILRERYNGLLVAGTYCPPFGFESDEKQMELLREAVKDAQPDLVYVALGSPKQERLIRRIKDDLPQAWWLGIGISLSFVSGHVKRAPRWVQKVGLEWCHRLLQEPRRLARRYLIDGIPFAARLLMGAAWQRLTGRAREGGDSGSGRIAVL